MLLMAALSALLLGPLCYHYLSQRREYLSLLDGFVFVSIIGLLAIEVLPNLIRDGGWLSVAMLLIGAIGPDLLERLFRRSARQVHFLVLLLAVAGLAVHAIFDGLALLLAGGHEQASAALAEAHHGHGHGHGGAGEGLALAVILHRIPVAITIWWLLKPTLGMRWAVGTLLVVAAATLLGYFFGDDAVVALGSEHTAAWGVALQALVAGAVLHVVFNRPHLGGEHAIECEHALAKQQQRERRFEGVGNILGMAALLLLFSLEGHAREYLASWEALQRLWELSLTSAPALLLGYVLAGLLSVWMPDSSIAWLSRGGRAGQAAKGMAFGLPLPVCSCGVVPLFRGLVDKGVPPAAALAFLVATPELGVDAFLLSLPLLGVEMTMLRLVVAGLLAFGVAIVVSRWVQHKVATADGAESSCCGHDHDDEHGHSHAETTPKWRQAANSGLVELVDHTAPWILLGLLIAAVLAPILGQSWLTQLPPTVDVVLFALLGLPVYVCATGSTPIAAAFIAVGVSPGAGLAFLLTGPATNVTTYGVLAQAYGRNAALGFAAAMIAGAVLAGWATNLFLGGSIELPILAGHDHASGMDWRLLPLLALIGLVLASVYRRGLRAFVGELRQVPAG